MAPLRRNCAHLDAIRRLRQKLHRNASALHPGQLAQLNIYINDTQHMKNRKEHVGPTRFGQHAGERGAWAQIGSRARGPAARCRACEPERRQPRDRIHGQLRMPLALACNAATVQAAPRSGPPSSGPPPAHVAQSRHCPYTCTADAARGRTFGHPRWRRGPRRVDTVATSSRMQIGRPRRGATRPCMGSKPVSIHWGYTPAQRAAATLTTHSPTRIAACARFC